MKCKICNEHLTTAFDTAIVLDKYEASYFKCTKCGFVQTQDPYWLDEAYSNVIGDSDIGLVSRNLDLMELTKSVITLFFNDKGKYIDYGGGFGLFVRLMRDKGYDFCLYEPSCENLFAKSFEVNLPTDLDFDLLTAFEVFEHLVDPMTEIEQMLKLSPNIFFSTTLIPIPTPALSQWWYYGLEGGQHVSFYSLEALKFIANKLGMRVYSNGVNYHLLTNKKISSKIFFMLMHVNISKLVNLFFHQPSLLNNDYHKEVSRQLD